MPTGQIVAEEAVFLNLPYDQKFERLYLAYIAGLSSLRLIPKVTLGIPTGERRLNRILTLIASCRYSIHDLSRVEIDRTPPRTPRFNMPFELGLAVAWAELNPEKHSWFICEAKQHRTLKSLSDLNGTDPLIHNGQVEGVMKQLCNAFVSLNRQPDVPGMMQIYRKLRKSIPALQAKAGTTSLFEARIFRDLYFAASGLAQQHFD